MKNGERALILSCTIVAIGAYVIPWCRCLVSLLGVFTVTGFAMGFSNTGSNFCCLRIWGKKGAPILQGLHFAFGLGGFVAPLLATPFLESSIPVPNQTLSVPQNYTSELEAVTATPFPTNYSGVELKMAGGETITIPRITFAYSIIGVFTTCVCVAFIFVHIFSSVKKCDTAKDTEITVRDPGLVFTMVVVIFAALQAGLISAVEISFSQMMTSYVVRGTHKLSTVTGSYMTSAYWGAFTLMRAVSIGLAMKVSCVKLLSFDLILSVTAILLLLNVGTWSVTALWVGTVLIGIGVASFFPGVLSWIEKYININNKIASIFTMVTSIFEMTVPMLINMYLQSNPNILFQFMLGASISGSVLFVILFTIVKSKGEKYIQEPQFPTADCYQESSVRTSTII